jgi:hypothetical protein
LTEPARSNVTRKRGLILLAVVVAAVVAVVLILALGDDDEGKGPTTTRDLLDDPIRIQPERDEAIALIRKGQAATVHARYEAVGDTTGGFPRAMEVWRKDGRSRTDSEYAAEGRVERSASIRDADSASAISCVQIGDAPWKCERVPAPKGDLFEQAVADLSEAEITARDDKVRGEDARCFAIDAGDALDLCFDEGGVMLRLGIGGVALELVDAEASVSNSDLEPPAEPTDPAPTTTEPEDTATTVPAPDAATTTVP